MPDEMIDFVGDLAPETPETPDAGGQELETGEQQESLGQSGSEPESRVYDEDYVKDLKNQLSSLNQQVVNYRRQANASKPNQYQVNDNGNTQERSVTYQNNLKLAKADLRDRVESFLHLYPELPSDIANQIRRNPLGYVRSDFFDNLNVDNASLDVEQWVANQVAVISKAQTPEKKIPQTQVNPNQMGNTSSAPQEPEENLWTMPMDQLEQKVRKELSNK